MHADSGCGYFSEKSTGFPQIPQTVWVAYIFFLLIRNCCWCEPLRSGLGIGIVYLRATQKTPHRSASCENIIRSFVNGGADVELARSRPAYTARSPKAWRRFKYYVLALSENQLTVWNRTQAHALTFCISPLRGLENWR